MKKARPKEKRRLVVKKERLRALTSTDLQNVNGGGTYDTKYCCPTHPKFG